MKNTRGGATLTIILMLAIFFGFSVATMGLKTNVRTRALIRTMKNLEGRYNSELAAWATYYRNDVNPSGKVMQLKISAMNTTQLVQSYIPGTMSGSKLENKTCGSMVFAAPGRTIKSCLLGK